MVSFTDLIELDPDTLRHAAGQWRAVAAALADQHAALGSRVQHTLQPPTWEGVAADAAQAHLTTLRSTVDRKSTRFLRIADTLNAAADGFGAARSAVLALCSCAERVGLLVGPGGTVTVNAAAVPDGPHRPARLAFLTVKANELGGAVTAVLRGASDLDDAVAMSLQESGFTSDGTGGAEAGEGSAYGDAMRAAEIAGGGVLTESDLAELNDLFAAHAGDPVFAATFFGQLGPTGTIDFLGVLASRGNATAIDQSGPIGDLQRRLSGMLALATDPSSEPSLGSTWTDQLLAAADAPVDVAGARPTGLQLVGALLLDDEVTYSTDFLTRFGEAAMAHEGGNSSVWGTDADFHVRLNFIDETSTGWDPMTGLMSALGANGEASTAFFDPTAHPGRVEYLLEDRAPLVVDVDYTFDEQDSPFVNELGNALDSATTIDYADPAANGVHSPAQAAIMAETVRILGSPDHLNGDVPDGLRDSVGEMVADYIGDVNHAMELQHTGGTLQLDENGQPLLTGEWSVFGGPREPHALFDGDDLTRVLGDTARDPNAYVTMYDAERAYTAVALDAAAAEGSGLSDEQRARAVESEAQNSASVFGTLDEARADAVRDGGDEADQAYNDAIGTARGVTNWVVGEVAGKIPFPGAGKGISWLVNEVFGLAEQDSSEATSQEVAALYDHGRTQAADLAFQAMWNNGLWPEQYPPPDILLPGGEPADLTTLTDEQTDAMNEWTSGIGFDTYMGDVLQDVDSAYTTGKDRDDESTGEP